jgi:hypothetical protein
MCTLNIIPQIYRILTFRLCSGGSILAEILKRRCSSFQSAQIHAAVRSQEQAQSLSKEDVRVIRLDLGDKAAVVEYLLSNDSRFTHRKILLKSVPHNYLDVLIFFCHS